MKNLSKNFSFSDMKKSIKNYFNSNRENIWVFVAIIAISFFSSLNIASGLNFSISDTTSVNDAVTFRETEEKVANVENKVSAKLATVKTASSLTRTVRSSNSSAKAATNSCLDYNDRTSIVIGGRNIPVVKSCTKLSETPDSGAAVSYFSGNPFIFGHNSADTFGHLKNLPIGTVFNFNGKNYRIVDSIVIPLNTIKSDTTLWRRLYNSNYNSSNNYDAIYRHNNTRYNLTIQTCENGSVDRRYILAVAI